MKKSQVMAWQAWNDEQHGFLEGVRREIVDYEKDFGTTNFYRVLLLLLDTKLVLPEAEIRVSDLRGISWGEKEAVFTCFIKVSRKIADFRHSFQCPEEVVNDLFAKLLEWTAAKIAEPYHAAFRKKEEALLQKVYKAHHVTSSTDLVPLE